MVSAPVHARVRCRRRRVHRFGPRPAAPRAGPPRDGPRPALLRRHAGAARSRDSASACASCAATCASFDRRAPRVASTRVVDLSGISNDPSCELEPELTRSVNVDGAKRLAVAAREAGRAPLRVLVVVLRLRPRRGPRPHRDERAPPGVALRARQGGSRKTSCSGSVNRRRGAMSTTCLRLATVFGLSPRMRFDLAINVMTKNAYVDRRITVDGGGRQWRPFVHVRDVARAFELALTSDARQGVAGEVFNVGSDANNVQILNLAFRVRDAIPGTEVVHAPTDPGSPRLQRVVREGPARPRLPRRAAASTTASARCSRALRDGVVDPDERRWYTLKQYVFLREAERAAPRPRHRRRAPHGLDAPRPMLRQGRVLPAPARRGRGRLVAARPRARSF